jgi:hypothetical protein
MSLTERVQPANQHAYYGFTTYECYTSAVSYSPLSKRPRLRCTRRSPKNSAGRAGAGPMGGTRRSRRSRSVNGVSDATNHLSRLRNILHGRPEGQTTRRPDGRTSSRKAGDERAPLTGKPKACEAVKTRFVFCSGCLFRRPRPFGFRHCNFRCRAFSRFSLKKKEPWI